MTNHQSQKATQLFNVLPLSRNIRVLEARYFVLEKTFLTFRTRFLDSIPKPLVVVKSLLQFSKGFLALCNQEFKLEVIHGLLVAEILTDFPG